MPVSPPTRDRPASRALWAALLLAAAACPDRGDPPSHEEQFDQAWQRFEETYPYFTLKGVDWAAERAEHRPRAAAARTEEELVSELVLMLGSLRDQHTWVRSPQGQQRATWASPRFRNFDAAVWVAYRDRWGVQEHGGWGLGAIGAVPYLYVSTFASTLDVAAIDAALEPFRDAPGFVVDVRMNGGGSNLVALDVAARFFDASRTVALVRFRNGPGHDDLGDPYPIAAGPRGAWQFTKPVLLLAGAGSFSSTEEFASAFRELPHATLAGDATGGSCSIPDWFALGGGWDYTVPRGHHTTPDGIVIEVNGVPPHVAIAVTPDDFAAGRDPVLDFAEAWAASPAVLRPAPP